MKSVLIVATVPEQLRVQYRLHFEHFERNHVRIIVACSGDAQGVIPSSATLVQIPLQRSMNLFSILRTIAILARTCVRFRPGVALYGSPIAALCGAIATRLLVPVRVFVVHGFREESLDGLSGVLVTSCSWLTGRLSSHVVFNSDSNAHLARSRRYVSQGVESIRAPGGFVGTPVPVLDDLGDQRARVLSLAGWGPEAVIVGFAGRLAHDKGVDDLVEAFVQLVQEAPNVRLLLIGDMDSADPISASTISVIQNDDRVLATGLVDDVGPWYGAMTIFCLPSMREGLPTVLLEAGARCIPVVGYRSSGIVDLIDERVGWLAEDRTPGALAVQISKALADIASGEAEPRVEAFYRRVVTTYSEDSVSEWWGALYRSFGLSGRPVNSGSHSC